MELYIDGKSIEDYPQLVYLIISAKFNAWATKMIFTVDVGNEFNSKRTITNSAGKQVNLKSEGDLLNYLFACGYEYVNNYPMTKSTGEKLNKFIFKRIEG